MKKSTKAIRERGEYEWWHFEKTEKRKQFISMHFLVLMSRLKPYCDGLGMHN